ncbi:Rrf2 family transcriptional regulator [Candidatus Poribacteria bacterium]|nr:Rrf2 family transcriptional regulator [Candidatus Poribacteria bacterium]
MITETCEHAIKALVLLGVRGQDSPLPLHEVARMIGCSAPYLSKTMNLLVRAGILKSHRGPQGGVALAQNPEAVTMRAIVEACQGLISGSYCPTVLAPGMRPCGFHRAMLDVHQSVIEALERWTLADLIDTPCLNLPVSEENQCKMFFPEIDELSAERSSAKK